MRRTARLALAFCCAFTLAQAAAPDAGLEERAARMAARLRCVVCQNQNLAESTAPLAADMRRELRAQLAQGRSEDEVVAFFEQRYGAFVRYEPPFRASTWLLWMGPFALLALGLVVLLRALARHTGAGAQALTPAERAHAEALLREDPP